MSFDAAWFAESPEARRWELVTSDAWSRAQNLSVINSWDGRAMGVLEQAQAEL